jgi:hypothetical protein
MRFFPWNSDRLSLDLQFATDKTLVARKGPTPTFTRASTATFVGSDGLIQSAAINEARFDHDPVTLACKGLLIEEARTNLSLQSGVIVAGVGWIAANTTSAVNGTGPDGNPAYQITETSANLQHGAVNTGSNAGTSGTSVVSGTNYTGSIFVKKVLGSVDWVQLTFGFAGFGSVLFANFNIGNGTIGNYTGLTSGTVPRIEQFPNGWYRISITAPAATTTSTFNTILAFTNNTDSITRFPSYLGSTSNEVLTSLWQLETGLFPTSYIPTTTAALTRSADVCSVTTAGWSNAGNDTMLAEYFDSTVTSGAVIVEGSPAISWMSLSFSSNRRQRNIYRHGGTSTRFDATTANNSVSLININKTALTSGEQLALNGSLTQTVASDPPQADISTSLSIGSRGNGASNFFNGHIARIKYFRKRLANAKLQTLTQLVSDADANAYITSLLSVGAAVTTTQQDAINTFVKAGKADGWWSSLKRLYLPIWASAAPNAVDMITRASGTFNGTVTHSAGYIQGNGTTGYFTTGTASNTLIATESGMIGTLNYTAIPSANMITAASGAGTGATSARSGSENSGLIPLTTWLGANVVRATIGTSGILLSCRLSGTTISGKRNTAGYTEDTNTAATTASMSADNFLFLARQTTAGFASNQIGAAFIADGVDNTIRQSFTLALKNLWESTTGLTLP